MGNGRNTAIFLISFALIAILGIYFLLTRSSTEMVPNESIPQSEQASYVNITAGELKNYVDADRNMYLLDVHIPEQEHIAGTDDFIPFNELAAYESELPNDKDTEIVVYCRSGSMSKTASQELIDMGYTNVKNLSGGINAWKAKGYTL